MSTMDFTAVAAALPPGSIRFPAKYRGTCPSCKEFIIPGEVVVQRRKGGSREHERCVITSLPTRPVLTAKPASEEITLPSSTTNPDVLRVLADALLPQLNGRLAAAVSRDEVAEIVASMSTDSVTVEALENRLCELEAAVVARIESATINVEPMLEPIARAIEPVVTRVARAEAERAGIRQIEIINRANQTVVTIDTPHELFPQLLAIVSLRLNAYLWGPAGSGKSTAAEQAAQALGLQYGYVSLDPQAGRSLLFGYMDASGRYVRTPFRNCYENGGVFCLDEGDNASPAIMVAINSAIENGACAFPDGLIQRHPDFILVMTGNTAGRGGDPRFANRRAFDAAFLDRFVCLRWHYDERMEEKVALSLNPKIRTWITWVRKVRAFVDAEKIDRVVSPRACISGAKLLADDTFTVEQVAEMIVFRGLETALRDKILTRHPLPGSVERILTAAGVGA